MARGDGIHRTNVRNIKITDSAIQNVQSHNEREKEVYSNLDIILDRTWMNVHFKGPNGSYMGMFDKMLMDGMISTRGLKPDACKFGELLFDLKEKTSLNSRQLKILIELDFFDEFAYAESLVADYRMVFKKRC